MTFLTLHSASLTSGGVCDCLCIKACSLQCTSYLGHHVHLTLKCRDDPCFANSLSSVTGDLSSLGLMCGTYSLSVSQILFLATTESSVSCSVMSVFWIPLSGSSLIVCFLNFCRFSGSALVLISFAVVSFPSRDHSFKDAISP